jgi:hypothetical protein
VSAAAVLRRFRDSGSAVDGQAAEGSVRWRQILELHEASTEALSMLAGWIPDAPETADTVSGADEQPEELFWGPCIRRLQEAADPAREENAVAVSNRHLESWEAEIARRSNGSSALSKSETAVLRAAALRVKAESETEAARAREGPEVPPELLRHARETLTHATRLDHEFAQLLGARTFSGAKGDDARQWMRTRLRLIQSAAALWLELDSVATR